MVYRLALSMSPYSVYKYKRGDLELDKVLVDVEQYSEIDDPMSDPDSLITYMKQ